MESSSATSTDNTLYDVATGGVGTTAAIEVLEGDNVFYHFHPNGGPIGVSDYGNAYYGTEVRFDV